MTLHLIGGGLLWSLAAIAFAGDDMTVENEFARERIRLVRGVTPNLVDDGFIGYLDSARKVNQRITASGAFIRVQQGKGQSSRWLPMANADDYGLYFPTLQYHDIVPMYGTLYRVELMAMGGPGAFVEFRRLGTDEVPKGVQVERDTYVFVVNGVGLLHEARFIVRDVEAKRGTKDASSLTVEFQPVIREVPGKERIVPPIPPPQSVSTGDYLHIAGNYHKVRRITLPDLKQRVLGWIELDSTSLKELPTKSSPSTKASESK